MANINTYAKLIKPPQFRPNEEVRIRMEFSQDLICCWATLVVNGYSITINENNYSGTKVTNYINESIMGTGITEFIIPSNTLAETPVDFYSYNGNGKVRAIVQIGKELDEDGNTIAQYYSNEILLDMLIDFDNDFCIDNTSLTANCSNLDIAIGYIVRHDYGTSGATDMSSYRIYLYDENYLLISDSGEKYDSQFSLYLYKNYTLENLKDNTKYYVRVKGVLNGGYVLWTEYYPIIVKYEDIPIFSDNLLLKNNPTKGCVNISLTENNEHNKVVISRTQLNKDNYLELITLFNPNNTIYYEDYYALPNTTYIYKVTTYNNDEIINTYYNTITHTLDGVVICDRYNHYTAIAYDTIYPIARNDRFGIITPMDREKPIAICNSEINYDSGSVSAIFTEIKDNCEFVLNNHSVYTKTMRLWLNNGKAKLLKYHTGECWIVAVNGVTDENEKTDIIHTTFSWTEIANANDNTAYVREGLIISE